MIDPNSATAADVIRDGSKNRDGCILWLREKDTHTADSGGGRAHLLLFTRVELESAFVISSEEYESSQEPDTYVLWRAPALECSSSS